MLEEAAHPIIAEHVAAVDALLNAPTSIIDRFRQLVHTYVRFNREHGYMLDYYILSAYKLEKTYNMLMLAKSHDGIIAFFQSGMVSGVFKKVSPELVQSMLWSICRYLGHLPESQYDIVSSPAHRLEVAGDQQSVVIDLFLDGLLQTGRSANRKHD